MTDTIEATEVDAEATEATEGEGKGEKTRDFSSYRPSHAELAEFINSHPEFVASGVTAVEPGQIKAVLALRADFNKLPEQVAKREERKREIEAEKAKFAGLTPEQIKAAKAADRAEKQAANLRKKADEAVARAEALKAAASGSAADLAAAVEAQTATDEGSAGEAAEDKPKRRIGRNRG